MNNKDLISSFFIVVFLLSSGVSFIFSPMELYLKSLIVSCVSFFIVMVLVAGSENSGVDSDR